MTTPNPAFPGSVHDQGGAQQTAPAETLAVGLRAGGERSPAPLARGTLGRQLVIRVTALVALVALLLTAVTALATQTVLVSQLDGSLDEVTARFREPDRGRPGGPNRGLLQPGQPVGTLAAIYDTHGAWRSGGILIENHRLAGVAALPNDAAERLREVPGDFGKRTVVLAEGLGRYRVVGVPATNASGEALIVVIGVPMREVDETMVQLLGLAAILSGLAIVGTVFVARALVIRSLRPLNRVAATAQQVSRLTLDRGEVALAVRVPPADADPTSEVGRVGEAFNHMLANVEDALAARQASEVKVRQFVADASHELRNPLAAIRGYAELTRRNRAEMPPDASFALSRVESEADRMSQLVEDMLLLARLDSRPDLDLDACDLSEIVLNAVSDARAAGPDHTWRVALPDAPVIAVVDRNRLHQVVTNLLANARTHTPPGTTVDTAVLTLGSDALITVSDDGPGIPEDLQDRVFERFTRAEVSRARTASARAGGSTGLGLAIVAAVVEAHRGSVSVASRPGRTEFTVRLPLAPAVVESWQTHRDGPPAP